MSRELVPEGRGWRHSRAGLASFFLLSLVAACFVLRLVLFLRFKPEAEAAVAEVRKAFFIGLHLDFFIALLMTVPLLGWMWVLPNRWFTAWWHRVFLALGFFLFWTVQTFSFIAEYYFFDEFKSRFNPVAVDYLLYPHEVFINIWDTYPIPTVIAVCTGTALVWLAVAHKLFGRLWHFSVPARRRFAGLAVAVVLAAALVPTVGFRKARFSHERLLNEVANNGTMSFADAWWTRHLDYAVFYRTLPLDEAYLRARALLREPNTSFTEGGRSLRRKVEGDSTRPKLNVVLILEESLGSEFWGTLGRPGETLMPEMEKLALGEGLFFTNIYASGNRTVRGLEGVLSSFPPLPGDSIVKRDRSDNVETIARVLKRDGYETVFLYGGRGFFDGMRSFALRNGFDRFIEQKDFEKPTFKTIWGVCDEDIMQRSVEECRALAKTGKPFLATVLSVSNHKPYTYPKGRIPEDPDKRQREHAVKYSDYALGQFFKAAKQEDFYTNTLFVVIADHGARVYGSQSIPIHSYEIPWVILGPAVVKAPARVPQLGCSLDVAPTILGLLGRPYESLFFGRDILRSPPEGNRVLIHHNRDIGIYRDERLITFGLNKTAEYYEGDPKVKDLVRLKKPGASDEEIEKDAIALFQTADDLYIQERYRLDK